MKNQIIALWVEFLIKVGNIGFECQMIYGAELRTRQLIETMVRQ